MRCLCGATLLTVTAVGCGTDVRPQMEISTDETPGYSPLIGRSWSLDPGANVYRCVRYTVPEDMYITSLEAKAGLGTHHTILTLASEENHTAGPDGEYDCEASTMGLVMLYASSVGTEPFDLPPGVGLAVKAGQQLHLQLHLLDTGDEPLAGETSVLVKSQDAPPQQLAEMVLAGKFFFTIPPGTPSYDVVGGCVADNDYSIFAAWPHMHQLAQHQKLELVRGGASRMVLDEPFSFGEQSYYRQSPPADVRAGDEVRVTCTYSNTTAQPVSWGDSQTAEMCFTGLYRYPVLDEGVFRCTDNP